MEPLRAVNGCGTTPDVSTSASSTPLAPERAHQRPWWPAWSVPCTNTPEDTRVHTNASAAAASLPLGGGDASAVAPSLPPGRHRPELGLAKRRPARGVEDGGSNARSAAFDPPLAAWLPAPLLTASEAPPRDCGTAASDSSPTAAALPARRETCTGLFFDPPASAALLHAAPLHCAVLAADRLLLQRAADLQAALMLPLGARVAVRVHAFAASMRVQVALVDGRSWPAWLPYPTAGVPHIVVSSFPGLLPGESDELAAAAAAGEAWAHVSAAAHPVWVEGRLGAEVGGGVAFSPEQLYSAAYERPRQPPHVIAACDAAATAPRVPPSMLPPQLAGRVPPPRDRTPGPTPAPVMPRSSCAAAATARSGGGSSDDCDSGGAAFWQWVADLPDDELGGAWDGSGGCGDGEGRPPSPSPGLLSVPSAHSGGTGRHDCGASDSSSSSSRGSGGSGEGLVHSAARRRAAAALESRHRRVAGSAARVISSAGRGRRHAGAGRVCVLLRSNGSAAAPACPSAKRPPHPQAGVRPDALDLFAAPSAVATAAESAGCSPIPDIAATAAPLLDPSASPSLVEAECHRSTFVLHMRAKHRFNAATAACRSSGHYAEAHAMADGARLHAGLARASRKAASATAFACFNAGVLNTFFIDLHGMHVAEAIAQLQLYLTHLSALRHPGGVLLQIITGKGKHSKDGRARILPSVLRFLEGGGYWHAVQADNRGCVQVMLGGPAAAAYRLEGGSPAAAWEGGGSAVADPTSPIA